MECLPVGGVPSNVQGKPGSFTVRYRVNRLVYCEEFSDITQAIDREKETKSTRRSVAQPVSRSPERSRRVRSLRRAHKKVTRQQKIKLIESSNPG